MEALTQGEVDDDLARVDQVVRGLRSDRTLWRAIFDRNPVAGALVDANGLITSANGALGRLLGRPPSAIAGTMLASLPLADDGPLLTDGQTEQRLAHPLGREVWAVASAVDMPEAGHGARLVSLDDATSRRSTEKLLLHAALHDSLTDLPNRRLLSDRIETALSRAERSSRTAAVLFLDLDEFKKINDSFGHDAGDTMLVAVARNIISVLRTCDTVARIGGDEFVVLCEDVSNEGDISLLVGRLLEAIRRPVQLDGELATVSASIGVAVPSDHETGEQLVRMADLAMYRAKHHPELDFVIADESLRAIVAPATGIRAELRHAIQAGELVLHYQPVVSIDGHVVGLEALVRWRHPRLGTLLPHDFLDAAVAGGLTRPLSDWVLRTAIAQAAAWHDPSLRVSVNVWADEVARRGFADTVGSLLARAGLPPHGLYLEMHEGELATAGPGLATELDQLRAMGVGLAIDDFGGGLPSSLESLRGLPVDTVKIDRSFVAGCLNDPANAAIVEAVAVAALAAGRHLSASGVESHEQLQCLRLLGYQSVQGHLISAALPVDELHDVINLRHVDVDRL